MYEQEDMDYQSGIDIRKHIETLGKRKGFILVFFFSAVLASLGLTYFVSEKYQAATTIFYRPMEVSLLRQKETESFGAPVPFAPFRVISQTLRDAVRNEAVLRPVVEALKLDEEIEVVWDTWYERWYHKSKSFIKARLLNLWELLKYGRLIEEEAKVKAIKRLRKNIDIETTKDSYIHILKVKDKYPQRAAKIVDLAGQGMVDWLRKQQQGQVEERLHQLEQRVATKEAQILDLQEQRKKLLEDNDLVSIREETVRALSNLYEMRLEGIRIGAQIQKKEKEVAEYEQGIRAKPNGYVQSEDIKNMRSAKLFGEVELKGLNAESGFMTSSVKDLEGHLAKLPSLQQRLEMLELQIASVTREHEHLKDLYTEASAQVMPAQGETRVLHTAVVPSAPVQPIKVYHVGLTAVLSLFFATGVAYLMDFMGIGLSYSLTKGKGGGKTARASRLAAVSEELKQTSQALKEFAREMAAEGGSLFLRSGDSLVLAKSLDPGHAPATIPMPLRKGSVFDRVMDAKKPLLIPNIEEAAHVQPSGWTGYKGRSSLVFPVTDETGEIAGIVSLHNKRSGPFTEKDKQRGAELLAAQIPDKTLTRGRRPIIRYPIIIVCGAILAGLVFYFLLKIGS